MGVLVFILVVGAIVGGIVWNKRNAGRATAGIDVVVPFTREEVVAAIDAAHTKGVLAAVRGWKGVRVGSRGSGFEYGTALGDHGQVTLQSTTGGTRVVAATDHLFVGTPQNPPSDAASGVWKFSWAVTAKFYEIAGITPNAAKMARFQDGLEAKIIKKATKAQNRA